MTLESLNVTLAPVSLDVGPKIIVTGVPIASEICKRPVSLPKVCCAYLTTPIAILKDVLSFRFMILSCLIISSQITSFVDPRITIVELNAFNSTIVILGSTNDVICDEIIKHDKIINLKDKTSLRMAMGVVKYAQHTLGSDTGLLHISEAMGTPVTMILGPTSKETGARVTLSDSRVIENKDLWCRPCSQNGSRPCYRKEQYCMTEIDSEKVYSNVSRALTL